MLSQKLAFNVDAVGNNVPAFYFQQCSQIKTKWNSNDFISRNYLHWPIFINLYIFLVLFLFVASSCSPPHFCQEPPRTSFASDGHQDLIDSWPDLQRVTKILSLLFPLLNSAQLSTSAMLGLGLLAAGHNVDEGGGGDLKPEVHPLAGRRHRQQHGQLGLQQLVLKVFLDLLLKWLVEEVVPLHLGNLLLLLYHVVQFPQDFLDSCSQLHGDV